MDIYTIQYFLFFPCIIHVCSPFRMSVCGPSQSGKATFVKNLFFNKEFVVCGELINKILFCCKSKVFYHINCTFYQF